MNLRIAFAVACGIVIGATVVARVPGVVGPPPTASTPPQTVDRAASVASRSPRVAAPPERSPSTRLDPDPYAAPATPKMARVPPSAPPTPGRIYRCRSNGTTTYSGDACANGQVIDGTSAVDGFDSRPSADLERLVANGRRGNDEAPPTNRVTRGGAGVGATSETVPCESMRRQIVDLDKQALYPNSAQTLDELRRVRQDIRTSMARLHC